MSRRLALLVALVLAGSAVRAAAQGVEVSNLAPPDAFTTPGRDTGLPAGLWHGASAKTARTVLPLLATKSLSSAGAALARRVLATGAPGPVGVGTDPEMIAGRASALLAQGDAKGAAAILARAPGLDRSPELAHVAAETALLAGDDARACSVADSLSSGRDDTYWLRLRAYCQAIAGHPDQAQLTFDLAQSQAKDLVFGRLMAARLAGVGDPGPASLRNGLDYALSRSLALDLGAARPSAAVAAALSSAPPVGAVADLSAIPPELSEVAQQLVAGRPVTYGAFIGAMQASSTGPKGAARFQATMLLLAALETPTTVEARDHLTQFALPEGRAPLGRNLALDAAGDQKLMGEAALLALWTCAEAGPAGPSMGDRVRIVRALHAVGLEADARAFVLEGLVSLK
jgi:hypothetical protein